MGSRKYNYLCYKLNNENTRGFYIPLTFSYYFVDSVHASQTQTDKNDESNNHQSNEINQKNMNSSGNTDDYSVLDFQKPTTPKKEYSRSQLLGIGTNVSDQNIKVNDVNLFASKVERINPKKTCEGSNHEVQQVFNDEFWSKVTTSIPDDERNSNFSDNTQKVNNWLNSGQNPSEYANITGQAASVHSLAKTSDTATNKFDETTSMVSTKSAIRAKLLDKTAKVKQTLRNLTNNN